MLTEPTVALVADIDTLCDIDPASLADGETIQELHRQVERLGALFTRAVAAFDAGKEWEAEGARSASAWVSRRCMVPMPVARRRVRLGRRLREMPCTEKAWLDGSIGQAHVEALARSREAVGGERFGEGEGMLVEQAAGLSYPEFGRVLAYWEQVVDPDGVEERATDTHERRRVHLSESFGGRWFLDGMLDPIGGTIVADTLKGIEEELFKKDWSEARLKVGEGVTVEHLARTPAQRRADALVEMATRARSTSPDLRRPSPLFTVLVDYPTLAGRVCELANRTMVTPGALLPWLTEAWVERVVFSGPDRVLNAGAQRRLFTGATRRAVEVRDRECYHPLCDTPAADCDIDHVQPHTADGLTVDRNGRPACPFHNRLRNRPP